MVSFYSFSEVFLLSELQNKVQRWEKNGKGKKGKGSSGRASSKQEEDDEDILDSSFIVTGSSL